MSNVQGKQENLKNKTNGPVDSGTQYHEEHAGNVTGYGEIDPIAKGVINRKNIRPS